MKVRCLKTLSKQTAVHRLSMWYLYSGADDQQILDGRHKDAWLGAYKPYSGDGLILPAVLLWDIIPARHLGCRLNFGSSCWCSEACDWAARVEERHREACMMHCSELTICRSATGRGCCQQKPRPS